MSVKDGNPEIPQELDPDNIPVQYGNEEAWAYLHGYNAAVEVFRKWIAARETK